MHCAGDLAPVGEHEPQLDHVTYIRFGQPARGRSRGRRSMGWIVNRGSLV
jgi:hypothetical protein